MTDLVKNLKAGATKVPLVQDNLQALQPGAMKEVFEPARGQNDYFERFSQPN